jgi:tubulin monoglycylase TTLL15
MAKKNFNPLKKTPKQSKFKKYEPVIKKIFIVSFGLFLSFFALDFSRNYSLQIKSKHVNETEQAANTSIRVVYKVEPRPKYWFYMARGYMWIFFSVDNVLKKLGLEKIEMNVKRQQKVHNDWDLLWSYDYHNEIPIDFSKVNYYQKVNHIPGNFVLCMKDNLAVNTDSRFIPKGFNNSESLLAYAEEHPEARFVQKLWSNRGVELKSADEINFKVFGPGYKYFAQLYVENPLLLDGRKFDFGVYVLITSIDPLRIYYYNKNTLIRMCEQKYNPDNYDDVDSYVISDACLFPWEVDALSVYYNRSFTYKEAMNAYFTKKGYDMGKVWREVETAIREIVLQKEYSFIYWVRALIHQSLFHH